MSGEVWAENVGRLRREYFSKDENKGAPPPLAAWHPDGSDFTFDGHRLSSLYRKTDGSRSRLIFRDHLLTSSLSKYSAPTGATGAESGEFGP